MLSTVQFEVMTTNLPVKTFDAVASSLSATLSLSMKYWYES